MAGPLDISGAGSVARNPVPNAPLGRGRLQLLFVVAVAASLVLLRIPYGPLVLYPFAFLGTWAHEMGHGLTSLLTGGGFERLEVYSDLGGVAFVRPSNGLAAALVAAGGLLGPAILGGLIIMFSARRTTAPYILAALGGVALLSVLAFVRNGFGIVMTAAIGVALVLIARFGPELVRIGVAQFVGIQLALASWTGSDYLFTQNFERDGQTLDSDTQNIADELFAPFWFWGGLIFAISLLILAAAFYLGWIRPSLQATKDP